MLLCGITRIMWVVPLTGVFLVRGTPPKSNPSSPETPISDFYRTALRGYRVRMIGQGNNMNGLEFWGLGSELSRLRAGGLRTRGREVLRHLK